MKLQYTLIEGGYLFDYETTLNLGKVKRFIKKRGFFRLSNGIRPLSVIFPDKIRWDKGIGFNKWDLTGIPTLEEIHIVPSSDREV